MAAGDGLSSGRLGLGGLIIGEGRFHPARFILTSVAIAIGVALQPLWLDTGNDGAFNETALFLSYAAMTRARIAVATPRRSRE